MFLLMLLGFGVSIDGVDDGKLYMSVITPKTDYGYVAEINKGKPAFYCDMIYTRNDTNYSVVR